MKRAITILLIGWSATSLGQLKLFLEREAEYQHLSGVVLVTKSDEVVLQECYGMSNGDEKNTIETRFDIGSITKQFTAAAILHLVKDGKIKLHDRINLHLGSYGSEKWEKVTIHQLLTHTGGVPSLYQTEQGLEIFLPEENPIGIQELISKFSDAKLLFSPGEEFSYSNSGYILLAAIIEQVSGQTYSDFLNGQIFEKYGLHHTSVGRPKSGKVASPFYGYRNDMRRSAPVYHHSWMMGAGGVYSTVDDLSKWITIITEEDFLTDDLRKLYLKSHTRVGYGYGWQFKRDSGITEHDGGSAGFISMLSFDPQNDEVVVILTNQSFEFGDTFYFGKSASYIRNLTETIWDGMANEPIEVLPKYEAVAIHEGSYRSVHGQTLRLTQHDSLVKIHLKDNYPTRLFTNTPLARDDELSNKMRDIATYLENASYWKLARHCDGEMKFVMYSGLMSIGMRMIKKKVGGAEEFIPYYAEKSHGLIRMKGTERILDLIVYFNSEGEIGGIFEHGFSNLDQEISMMAYPTGQGAYYLDGMPYGERSITFEMDGERLIAHQMDRTITFSK